MLEESSTGNLVAGFIEGGVVEIATRDPEIFDSEGGNSADYTPRVCSGCKFDQANRHALLFG